MLATFPPFVLDLRVCILGPSNELLVMLSTDGHYQDVISQVSGFGDGDLASTTHAPSNNMMVIILRRHTCGMPVARWYVLLRPPDTEFIFISYSWYHL